MKYLSICSGIEAASVAWEPLGWTPLAFSEIEQFPREVLQHHYPDVPLYGDFTKLRDEPWIRDADVLIGGTPCQAFSVAGLRKSLDDDRGNLALEFVRLADAMHESIIIVWENVPGVLNVKDNAFGCFLAALVGDDAPLVPPRGKWSNAGLVAGPKRRAAWRILDAQYFGVPQRRRRVFVVASARDDFDPAEVLFEREGVQRHTAPRREAGKGASGYAASSIGGYRESSIGGSIRAAGGDLGGGSENLMVYAPMVAHSLRAEGFDASEDGTGRGTPIVPVAYDMRGREGGAQFEGPHETANICAASGGSSRSYIAQQWAVRRLTPTECERLQGFPDGWTDIPRAKGKPAADGPRYKSLGNSMAVPVIFWIGKRIQMAVDISNG